MYEINNVEMAGHYICHLYIFINYTITTHARALL